MPTHIFSRDSHIKKLTEVSLIMHIRTILVLKVLKKDPRSIDRVMALSALRTVPTKTEVFFRSS